MLSKTGYLEVNAPISNLSLILVESRLCTSSKYTLLEKDLNSELYFFQNIYDTPHDVSHMLLHKSEDYEIKRFILPDLNSVRDAKVLKFGLDGRYYSCNYGMVNSHSEKIFRKTLSKEDG